MAMPKRPTCSGLSSGLDESIRACPPGFATWDLIRRPNSGLQEERSRTSWHACATDFGWVSPLSVGRRHGRVDFKPRYPNTARKAAASRPAIAKHKGRTHENDNVAQIASPELGGDRRRARPRRQARSRPGRADPDRRHL